MNLVTDMLTGARSQNVVIERRQVNNEHPEWWVMFTTGDVQMFDFSDAALKAVKAAAKKGNETVTVTTIEWRNVPDGWKPPQ